MHLSIDVMQTEELSWNDNLNYFHSFFIWFIYEFLEDINQVNAFLETILQTFE